MQPKPIAFTVREAADLCSLSRAKLYELIKAGKLSIRKCGSRSLVRYQDLQNLIDSLPSFESEEGDDA